MNTRVEVLSRQLRAGGVGTRPISVIQVGLGPIGIRMIKDILTRKGIVLTGAVDIDPRKLGRDVAEICDLPSVCPTHSNRKKAKPDGAARRTAYQTNEQINSRRGLW